MNESKKEVIEFIKLAEELRSINRDAFLEAKGYLRGLVQKGQPLSEKVAQ